MGIVTLLLLLFLPLGVDGVMQSLHVNKRRLVIRWQMERQFVIIFRLVPTSLQVKQSAKIPVDDHIVGSQLHGPTVIMFRPL